MAMTGALPSRGSAAAATASCYACFPPLPTLYIAAHQKDLGPPRHIVSYEARPCPRGARAPCLFCPWAGRAHTHFPMSRGHEEPQGACSASLCHHLPRPLAPIGRTGVSLLLIATRPPTMGAPHGAGSSSGARLCAPCTHYKPAPNAGHRASSLAGDTPCLPLSLPTSPLLGVGGTPMAGVPRWLGVAPSLSCVPQAAAAACHPRSPQIRCARGREARPSRCRR